MRLFKDIPGIFESESDGLVIHCLVRKTKWESFMINKSDEFTHFWSKSIPSIMAITDVTVPDPDDLNNVLEVKLIRIVLNLS